MEIDNVIKVTVGVVIAIIMVVAFAIPVFSGFTESNPGVPGTNAGMDDPDYSLYVLEPNTTITFTKNNDEGTVTIGDWTTQITNDGVYFAIATTGFSISMISNSTIMAIFKGSMQVVGGDQATIIYNGSSIELQSANVNFNGDASDVVAVLEKQSAKPDWAKNDEYVQISNYSSNKELDAYVNPESVIYASAGNTGILLFGTYNNMVVNVDSGLGERSISFETQTTGDAIHLISYTPSESSAYYNMFVPATYYLELPVKAQVSGAIATIIDILPLIMVVGIMVAVAGAAGLFILNRRS